MQKPSPEPIEKRIESLGPGGEGDDIHPAAEHCAPWRATRTPAASRWSTCSSSGFAGGSAAAVHRVAGLERTVLLATTPQLDASRV